MYLVVVSATGAGSHAMGASSGSCREISSFWVPLIKQLLRCSFGLFAAGGSDQPAGQLVSGALLDGSKNNQNGKLEL